MEANISSESALDKLDTICADELMHAKLRGLMLAYHARWKSQDIHVIGIEELAFSDLYNPATSAKSRTFQMAGIKDVLLLENEKPWLMDHKTTSEDIADPNSPYWRQLVIEGQHQHYMLIDHLNGQRLEGAVWDVVRKPLISPRQISKADLQLMDISKKYFNHDVTQEQVREAKETGREDFKLYEYRLAYDAERTRPEWYFQRFRVARLDNELVEYASELWGHTQDLLIARRENRWPRNSGACMNYGRPCKFLGICSGHDTPDSDKWKPKEWVHNELPIITDNRGRGLLTNSRIRTFQTCRKKHYFDYELGIDRVEPEEVESLLFGQLWHTVLAEYFKQWKGQCHDSNSNAEAIAVAGACNQA